MVFQVWQLVAQAIFGAEEQSRASCQVVHFGKQTCGRGESFFIGKLVFFLLIGINAL